MYAVFYPEHQGYYLVDQLGNDGSALLLRGVKDDRLCMRRKQTAVLWPTEHDHEMGPIKDYHEVAGMLTRVHCQTYKHLDEAQASTDKDGSRFERFKSIATLEPSCNGGKLQSFMDSNSYDPNPKYNRRVKGLKSDRELEVFIWHVFSRLLQAYDNLYDKGTAHLNGYNHNIFLHFEGKAKFPEIYLCSWSYTEKLDKAGIENGMALLYVNIMHLMNRTSYRMEEMSDMDCRFPAKNCQPKPDFSRKLVSCVQELGKLARPGLDQHFDFAEYDVDRASKPLGLKGLRDGIHDLWQKVTKHAENAKATIGVPNMSSLHKCKTLPNPKVYKSRADLLAHNIDGECGDPTAGPWRIARLSHSGFIAAVEKTDINLLEPELDKYNERTKYDSKKAETPCGGDYPKLLRQAQEQDQAGDDKIVHSIFEVDTHWSQAKLYAGELPGKKGKVRTPKKPAGVSKRGPKKEKKTKPQVKGARQSARLQGKGPEEYEKGL